MGDMDANHLYTCMHTYQCVKHRIQVTHTRFSLIQNESGLNCSLFLLKLKQLRTSRKLKIFIKKKKESAEEMTKLNKTRNVCKLFQIKTLTHTHNYCLVTVQIIHCATRWDTDWLRVKSVKHNYCVLKQDLSMFSKCQKWL